MPNWSTLKEKSSGRLSLPSGERSALKVQMRRALDNPGGIWRELEPAVSQAEVTGVMRSEW